MLIDKGADIHRPIKIGYTALHLSAQEGYLKITWLLVQRGGYPHTVATNGGTPLFTAAQFGNWDVVKLLMQHGADIRSVDSYGATVLMVCRNPDFRVLPDDMEYINRRDNTGMTALMWAATQRSPEKVQKLLAKGAWVHITDLWGRSVLHNSAYFASEYVMRILLRYSKSIINDSDINRFTPLHLAINRETKHDIIRQFVNAGSDPNAKDKFGRTPNDHLLLRYKHRDEVEKEDVLYSIRMDPFGRMKAAL